MPKAAQVDGQRLRATLWKAIRRVYECDAVLLRDRVQERSVLFHIGRHVAAAIDDWQDSWQVDLEYNRDSNRDTLDRISKYLPVTPGRNEGAVLPDLIVHDRSESTADSNLLVMEPKYAAANRVVDYGKLRGFREVLRYRITVFLELQPHPQPPRWLWCDVLDNDRSIVALDPRTALPSPLGGQLSGDLVGRLWREVGMSVLRWRCVGPAIRDLAISRSRRTSASDPSRAVVPN